MYESPCEPVARHGGALKRAQNIEGACASKGGRPADTALARCRRSCCCGGGGSSGRSRIVYVLVAARATRVPVLVAALRQHAFSNERLEKAQQAVVWVHAEASEQERRSAL
jgi:hypothetical protein